MGYKDCQEVQDKRKRVPWRTEPTQREDKDSKNKKTTADRPRAASVSAYVGLINAEQTLEETLRKSKLYATCLGGKHLHNIYKQLIDIRPE